MIEIWNLPPEFEVSCLRLQSNSFPDTLQIVCRDFWALHLSLLPTPPPAEPYLHSQDEKPPFVATLKDDRNSDQESTGSTSDSSDSSENEDEEDPGMADLMHEASESESSSNEDVEAGIDKRKGVSSDKRSKRSQRHDHPAGNLAVILCACWTLRVPLIYQDLIRYWNLYFRPKLCPN